MKPLVGRFDGRRRKNPELPGWLAQLKQARTGRIPDVSGNILLRYGRTGHTLQVSVLFPDQLACAENRAGAREEPMHPLCGVSVGGVNLPAPLRPRG